MGNNKSHGYKEKEEGDKGGVFGIQSLTRLI